MKKLKHVNLHGYGDANDVYESLQGDFNRDTWREVWWYVFLVGAAWGVYSGIEGGNVAKTVAAGTFGLGCLAQAIRIAVDNSNRNWAMHVIDWMEVRRSEDEEKSRESL